MNLIIDISETDYEWLKRNPFPLVLPTKVEIAIANGIPLGEMLDEIRAEIVEYKDDKIIHAERNEMIDIVIDIIDKYRNEVSEK